MMGEGSPSMASFFIWMSAAEARIN